MSLITAMGDDQLLTAYPGIRHAPRILVHEAAPNRPVMQTYPWADAPVPQPGEGARGREGGGEGGR